METWLGLFFPKQLVNWHLQLVTFDNFLLILATELENSLFYF